MKSKESIIDVIMITCLVLLFGGLLVFGVYKSKNYVKPVTTTTTSWSARTTEERTTTTTTSSYEKTTSTTTTNASNGIETELLVFHGGSGEVTYKTYIYRINPGHANMGYKYKNETCISKSWGSSELSCKETKTGQFDKIDDAFKYAKSNNAYSYATVPGDNSIYTINEIQNNKWWSKR